MSQRVLIIGKNLASLRRQRYLTQEEFAQKLDMSPANVRRLEQSEMGGMQVKNFRRLAALVGVSPDDLRRQIGAVDEAKSPTEVAEAVVEAPPPPPVVPQAKESPEAPSAVRFASQRDVVDVSHYHGVSAARIESRTDADRGKAPIPAGSSRRVAVTVDGDCMEPRYFNGDVVIFSVDQAEREGVIDGKNYFVQFADGENTFKRLFLHADNRELLVLRCWNSKYPDRIVERAKIKLLARAMYRLMPDE